MTWKAVVLSLIAIFGFIVRESFRVEPGCPPPRYGDTQPVRPSLDTPPFYKSPLADNYQNRKALYLDWLGQRPVPNITRDSVWNEMARIENGQDHFPEETLEWLLRHVNERRDCSDFIMAGLVRLYFTYSNVLDKSQEERIKKCVLDFQYWIDEPNPDKGAMELWTENHQILAFSSEYLAGQIFPDETFTNNGMSGLERLENAAPKVLRWMEWRFRTGFAEWDSLTYYPEDLAALLNLVDLAGDKNISTRAAMLVDLILFDIAVDSFYGQYGTSHGRATTKNVLSAAEDPVVTTQALMWGLGRFQSDTNMASISLALSDYTLPPVLERIAQDMPDVMVNRERHSIPLTEEEIQRRNLSLSSSEDIVVWWGMGAFTHPLVIEGSMKWIDEWDMWHYPDFRDFKTLGKFLAWVHLLGPASNILGPDSNGAFLTEVNKVTYRTPDYMLSCAQDWRKGEKGYQQHIWQATLGPYAVVFVNNPDSLNDGDRPGYWISNGRNPRCAQSDNVLVAIHRIDEYMDILEARHYAFTHAYFPKWAFDEVKEIQSINGGGWVFGRKGDGYIGLYSHNPYEWQDEGIDADQEIIAAGRENIWICHMGRRLVDGNFDDFVKKIISSNIDIKGLDVTYQAHGIGDMRFGWTGPMTVDGEEVSLGPYPRWDNPYSNSSFDSGSILIEHGGLELELDIEDNVRQYDILTRGSGDSKTGSL